jgi:hypothetical protein
MTTLYNPKIITNGLVLYLDAGNRRSYPGSGTVWSDLSTNNNNATLTNGPTFDNNSLGSIVFDGTNDYITLGNISTLDMGTDTRTISMWLKTNSSSGMAVASKYQTDTVESGWLINIVNGKINSLWKNSGGTGISHTSTNSVNDNKWHEVVVVFRRSGIAMTIYIDGILDSNSSNVTGTIGNNTRAVLFGAVHTPTNVIVPQYAGNISISKIYNKELIANEILQNFNAFRGRFGV